MIGSNTSRQAEADRGQAYTLEGFIGAMIVLMALLLALQSAVITSSTGGGVDRSVQPQLQQEVTDTLTVAATGHGQGENGSLSYMIRYWNDSEDRFHGAAAATEPDDVYDKTEFNRDNFVLGQILSDRFGQSGRYYNVELIAENDRDNPVTLVDEGSPSSEAYTASYTVTLYEDDTLTAPGSRDDGITLEEASNDPDIEYPIPPANGGSGDGPVYNVVEVRVVVW